MVERLGKFLEEAAKVDPKKNDWKKLALGVAATGVAAGLVGVAGITMRDHREKTHRSYELHPLLQAFFDAEQRSLGIEGPNVWAAVHRIHHNMTDASLKPFLDIHRAIRRFEERGLPVPESYPYLDPFVPSFSKEQVQQIGSLAEAEVKQRLGDSYHEPDIDPEMALALLTPQKSQYYYPEYPKHNGPYTQDDKERLLLTDPHSPALVRQENGVQGMMAKNMPSYQRPARLFREDPQLRPDDLAPDENEQKSVKPAVIGGFVVPTIAVLFARGRYTPKDVAIAAIAGSAINGIRAGVEVIGGNITNSLGHGGDMRDSLGRVVLDRGYKIKLNPDGTLSTDTRELGVMGKLLSVLTFDEVGGQDVHHKYPDKIAYTHKKGLAKLKDAPWGTFLEYMAHSEAMPLMKPGKGFEGIRPDLPHEGVVLIQQARASEYERQHANPGRRSFDNTRITDVVDGI